MLAYSRNASLHHRSCRENAIRAGQYACSLLVFTSCQPTMRQGKPVPCKVGSRRSVDIEIYHPNPPCEQAFRESERVQQATMCVRVNCNLIRVEHPPYHPPQHTLINTDLLSRFGEPFVTAAGVLGLMAVWRSFYTVYLDFWNVRTFNGSSINRYQDMTYFMEALR